MNDKEFYNIDEMFNACKELKNNNVIGYGKIDKLISIIKSNNVLIKDLVKQRVSDTLSKVDDINNFKDRVITDVGIFKLLQDSGIDFKNTKISFNEEEISLLDVVVLYRDNIKDHMSISSIHPNQLTDKDDIISQLNSIELRENLKNEVQDILDTNKVGKDDSKNKKT